MASSSELHKGLFRKSLPPLPPPELGVKRKKGGKKDYSPVSWSQYFDSQQSIAINSSDRFNVYVKGSDGPLVLLIHGGGYSGLSWAVFTESLMSMISCTVIALDMRGHGSTVTGDDYNLSQDILVNDVASVFNEIYKEKEAPPTLIMGHSMGGAIAVRVAAVPGLIKSLVGVALIDIVEGTALESLSGMQSFLRSRPKRFPSLENAVEWSIRSGQLRNIESARVSMPGQLKEIENEGLSVPATLIPEEDSKEAESSHQTTSTSEYTWRVDLTKTETYWRGWFEGLSGTLLSISGNVSKIIILAGVDRLDKQLTIAHMQGKIQLQVLSGCGHTVHEDAPDKVAHILANHLIRYKLATPKEGFENFSSAPVPMC
ncbi:PREDICTED: protein phosphatase methylesterase 1-like isoform X2 [Amphimedon queenslandica]|uniref:Protein phosphatase methylesterase 1 n=1 Tax=Amphimedon queenslandica TaxID=400682 RepID=A0A1X7V3A8_AMPQE|nr:PREDICTED: protein phosphatase methylesterase 1-like isoform X2 [Amphimedon queenslandica]|eukprot:XP_019850829.1 PREDICTED: protein phosphatase methylesterase 1-like isoform X2 [Amphimedon queenslandica]